ncbi:MULTISPECIES: hypothetical protein [Chryseobacterium]|uniref:Uncharacterized protein n=1 Tax=Chryseobacterium taihuense TaxID=1141221 RepID=A0A4U8WDL5_9FLAO|nr:MULTISPECIES: hypothetical protein [Chryseobacterium]QQV02243.1 hypothetical protein I6I61_14400 [Chryseobacterium sp. FDAARGOS 1104]VFB04517.1 Uncharacterised protein [Chryseobacterium taihuense]
MNTIIFDYKIDFTEINSYNYDLDMLDIFQLKNVFKGHIFICFYVDDKRKRNFILLDTGILDYINQFDKLITYIDKGNKETFTVSSDYYSNSMNYIYNLENDILEIYETNSAIFNINCKYEVFKKAYKKFRKNTINELLFLYPKLQQNSAFNEYFCNNNFIK